MVLAKVFKISVFILFFVSLFSVGFSYPQFQYDMLNLPSGDISIEGLSSSGVEVNLYANNNFVGKVDVISARKDVLLNDSITDETVNVGSTLRFYNNAPGRVYKINITDTSYRILNYQGFVDFQADSVGSVIYRDEEEGVQKTITVTDELVNFSIDGAATYLEDGSNELRFVVKTIRTGDINEFNYTVNYEKYSNEITVTNFPSITNKDEVTISGTVYDPTSPLYYVLNYDGVISNPGALNPVELKGNSFNFTISDLSEGNNSIRLITTQSDNINIFNGEKKISVLVDTIDPTIDIEQVYFKSNANSEKRVKKEGSTVYANSQGLVYNITTDATVLNYTFDNRTDSAQVINGTVMLELNQLEIGDNPLILLAIDIAGNTYKESHVIKYDNKKPELEESDPDSGKEVHSPFVSFEGKVNKGDVEVTVFSFPEGTKDKEGNPLTCDKYENLFYRNLGQLDNQNPDGPELNLNETQISLLSLISKKETVTTDSEGNFDVFVVLQEKSFDGGYIDNDGSDDKSPTVKDVKSRNTICVAMLDKFGNTAVKEIKVTLDTGNTMWKPGEVTTIPNTLYASEIEMSEDTKVAGGQFVEFSLISKFSYVGGGKITHVENFKIDVDNSYEDSKNIMVDSSRMNWKLDKNTGELITHIPVQIRPLGIEPAEYPGELELGFQVYVNGYQVNDKSIPIDTKNPIYFKTTINIERPLDHTKWLTPEMIDDMVEFLNKSISFTEKAVQWTGYASVAGVLTCTGAKFMYGMEVATAQSDEQKEEAKRRMLMICDRVACTASPKECVGEMGNFDSSTNSGILNTGGKERFSGSDSSLDNAKVLNSEDKVLARFQSLSIGSLCDYNGDGTANDGVMVSGDVARYESSGGSWYLKDEKSMEYVNGRCAPANFMDGEKKPLNPEDIKCDANGKCELGEGQDVNQVDLKGASGACFSSGAPQYDDTRCNFFGADPEGVPGYDPSDNIFESVRCGCVTDTYSHLKNYLKIQQNIKGCLEQAKVGNVKGAYCERLMGQAVCDIATNVLFNTITQESTRTGSDGKTDYHESPLTAVFSGLREGDSILNERYEGTFYSQAGMTTEQIVNKACLAAITGDWSVLSENILTSIDQNEVEPIFGPMIPESRMQGYNPLTGELTFMYTFSYGVVSGGQPINSRITFICDKNAPGGEYCPEERITSDEAGASFNIGNLYTPKGGSSSRLVRAIDTKARFRYNIVQIEHKYTLKGETKTKTYEENIFHKGEFMLAQCYFTAGLVGEGAGFSCETLFDDQAMVSIYSIDKDKSHLSPTDGTTPVYYPGNKVFLNLFYRAKNSGFNQQTGFDVAYKAVCKSAGDGTAIKMGVASEVTQSINFGSSVFELFEVPAIGEAQNNQYSKMKLSLSGTEATALKSAGGKLVFYNLNGMTGNMVSVTSVEGLDKTKLGGVLIGQNLNVNQNNNANGDAVQLTSESIIVNSDGKTEIVLQFSNPVKDLGVALYYGDNKQKLFEIVSVDAKTYNEFDKLAEGLCDLSVRILPPGKGQAATADPETFDSYDPMGDDIAVDSKLKSNDLFKTTFFVKSAPNDVVMNFELVKPFRDQSICVDNSGQFDVGYVALSSNNEFSGILKYNFGLDRYDLGSKNSSFSISSGSEIEKIDFGDVDKIEEGTQPGFFSYEVVLDKDLGTGRSKGTVIDSGRIDVNYYFSENCNSPKESVQTPSNNGGTVTPESPQGGDGDGGTESSGVQRN